jgi:protein TonB
MVPEPVRRVASPKVKRMEGDEEDESLFARHRKKLVAIVLAVVGGVAAILVFTDKKPATHKAPDRSLVKIQLPPLPPPPPPPPPPPQPKIEPPKQEMVKEELPEEKPEETPPEPKPADDPPPLGTGIKGDGPPDGFGLSGSGTGRIGGLGSGGGSRSKWGWYAGQVQRSVSDALRSHRRTRNAMMNSIEVRIWPDRSTGRVTRVSLSPSTGDAALDAAIRDEVLGGLQLQQAPPDGMPTPIVMRINARRP